MTKATALNYRRIAVRPAFRRGPERRRFASPAPLRLNPGNSQLQNFGRGRLECQHLSMFNVGDTFEQGRRVGNECSSDLSSEMREAVFLAAESVEDCEIPLTKFHGEPVDRAL